MVVCTDWWAAQIGGLTWWDASLSTTLCKENKEEICLRF